jgi:hypothetical protein
MNTKVIIAVVMLVALKPAAAQHYIGLHKDEVKQLMKENMKGFNLDNTTVNKKFNYLKYVDALGEQTILYFLDDGDYCKAVRHMCDWAGYNEMLEKMNSTYTQLSSDTWIYEHRGGLYQVKLEEGEWFFTFTTQPKKDD